MNQAVDYDIALIIVRLLLALFFLALLFTNARLIWQQFNLYFEHKKNQQRLIKINQPKLSKWRLNHPTKVFSFYINAKLGDSFSSKQLVDLVDKFKLVRAPNNGYQLIDFASGKVLFFMIDANKPYSFAENLQKNKPVKSLMLVIQLPVGEVVSEDMEKFIAYATDMADFLKVKVRIDGRVLSDRDLQKYYQSARDFERELQQWRNY